MRLGRNLNKAIAALSKMMSWIGFVLDGKLRMCFRLRRIRHETAIIIG